MSTTNLRSPFGLVGEVRLQNEALVRELVLALSPRWMLP